MRVSRLHNTLCPQVLHCMLFPCLDMLYVHSHSLSSPERGVRFKHELIVYMSGVAVLQL